MHIDIVTVADVPADYDTRLIPIHVDGLARLRLRAFERHDLVLAKLCRNIDRDREDVVALARGPGLDIDVLRQRYRDELRPKLGRPEREDLEQGAGAALASRHPGRSRPALCLPPGARLRSDGESRRSIVPTAYGLTPCIDLPWWVVSSATVCRDARTLRIACAIRRGQVHFRHLSSSPREFDE
ncbi:MAG: DUF6036 family nucleotidyltransferase [Vicinamibacterales bacterium]